MTKEEKDLLLKDLCARLPYNVKVHAKCLDMGMYIEVEKSGVLSMIDADAVVAFTSDNTNSYDYVNIHEAKSYLFPLSSMSDEQKKEYYNLCFEEERKEWEFGEWITRVYYHNTIESIDWLNENHFDYRGLILKGLAIDCTNLDIY